MTTSKKQFQLFKSECKKWIDIFKLDGWEFGFYLLDTNSSQAQVFRDYIACTVKVNFNTIVTKRPDESYNELIKETAKHEMIHILLGNLALLAGSRFVTSDELEKAEEELTIKLARIV